MTRGYVVIWRDRFFDGDGWSSHPLKAKFYRSKTVAFVRSKIYRGARIAEAWE